MNSLEFFLILFNNLWLSVPRKKGIATKNKIKTKSKTVKSICYMYCSWICCISILFRLFFLWHLLCLDSIHPLHFAWSWGSIIKQIFHAIFCLMSKLFTLGKIIYLQKKCSWLGLNIGLLLRRTYRQNQRIKMIKYILNGYDHFI